MRPCRSPRSSEPASPPASPVAVRVLALPLRDGAMLIDGDALTGARLAAAQAEPAPRAPGNEDGLRVALRLDQVALLELLDHDPRQLAPPRVDGDRLDRVRGGVRACGSKLVGHEVPS